MGIDIGKALRKLELLTPEEWETLRAKIEADTDKETEEVSKRVVREYAARRGPEARTK
jgi:hypothetical protein